MNNQYYLREYSRKDFYDFWEINKTDATPDAAVILQFFNPLIRVLPHLVKGAYYWHIFENLGAASRILYAGGAVEQLTPINGKQLLHVTPEQFFTFFHPDDLQPTFTFLAKMFELLLASPAKERSNYNCCLYMRMKNAEHTYEWYSMQYPALLFDEQGAFKLGIVVYTSIQHIAAGITQPMLTILNNTDSSNSVFSTYYIDRYNQLQQHLPALTSREQQIVGLLSQGHSSKQIAATLGLSKNTVDNQRQRLLKKFGVRSSAQLVIKAAIATIAQ